jgi:uncharacterized protein (DUF305 family)
MKRLFSVLAMAVAAFALAACGNNTDTAGGGSSSRSNFNDADVTFAQSMIPHHEQAVVMAKMAKSHASSAEVKDLAAKIEAAQGPEIKIMSGWLNAWGEDASSGSGMNHGMGGNGMPGMMGDDDMMSLDSADGAGFDRMFLTMMIEHHEGAIEMAMKEQVDGKNQDAVALAKKIESDQTAEIAVMKDLLKS